MQSMFEQVLDVRQMKYVGLLLGLLSVTVAQASDLERERRMAQQIVDAILDGDPVYLRSGVHEFLGIYTEADESKGAVVIMHGRGFHPDWVDTANPLRVGLAENGWNTLSIQMPVLQKWARYYDYVPVFDEAFPRIEAAITFLQQQGHSRIVLVAHSCSVHMVNAWIKEGRFRDGIALVGIGMGATDYGQKMVHSFQFDKPDVPVLDIYGSEDYPAVHRTAPARLNAISQAGGGKSEQIVVPDADHYFTDKGDALVEAVSGWLNKL